MGALAASREKPTQQRGPSTARNKTDAQTQTVRSLCIWLLLLHLGLVPVLVGVGGGSSLLLGGFAPYECATIRLYSPDNGR